MLTYHMNEWDSCTFLLQADAIHLKQQMRIKKQDYAQFLKTQIAQKPERQPKMGIDRPLMPCEQREKSLIDVQMRQGQYKMELEVCADHMCTARQINFPL